MAELDYTIENLMFEEAMWRDSVGEYIDGQTDHELMSETRKVLHTSSARQRNNNPKEYEKAQSILTKGIIYQKLTDRQRYALGDFIMGYMEGEFWDGF